MKESVQIQKQGPLRLRTGLPGDKSISHRAVMIGSIARGTSVVRNLLESGDVLSTVRIFRSMGVRITRLGNGRWRIEGKGLRGLRRPRAALDCGNSGTTMRLMAGILSGQPFRSVLTGDASLRKRPMDRVIAPLAKMGARIRPLKGGKPVAPLVIEPAALKPVRYVLPVASAQVKSAVLLAGLYAPGRTAVVENEPTRNHSEIFLRNTGVDLQKNGKEILLTGSKQPRGFSIEVPGDVSSAAFLMVMGALVQGSDILLKNVLWNQTRTGVVRVLKRMGARLEVLTVRDTSIEWAADIRVKSGPLKSTRVPRKEIPSLIDELPVIMVAATQARGTTLIQGAGELRVKETDRVHSMVSQLKKMGADISVKGDDIRIKGPTPLRGAAIKSFGDHRTAMSFIVAGMVAEGTTSVHDIANINTSFPSFFQLLRKAGCRFRL